MKKALIGFLVGVVISLPVFVLAGEDHEWSGWWDADNQTKIQRIYDDENDLVCWIARTQFSDGSVSISCVKI